jgi:hypothetical protein
MCAVSHVRYRGLARIERAEIALRIERVSAVWVVRASTIVLVVGVVIRLEDHATGIVAAGSVVITNRRPALDWLAEVVLVVVAHARPRATVRVGATEFCLHGLYLVRQRDY